MGVTPGRYMANIIRSDVRSSPGSLAPDDTISELETTPVDFGVGAGQSPALLEGGLSNPVVMDDLWNEFDIVLAAEHEQISGEPRSIDPRLVSLE